MIFFCFCPANSHFCHPTLGHRYVELPRWARRSSLALTVQMSLACSMLLRTRSGLTWPRGRSPLRANFLELQRLARRSSLDLTEQMSLACSTFPRTSSQQTSLLGACHLRESRLWWRSRASWHAPVCISTYQFAHTVQRGLEATQFKILRGCAPNPAPFLSPHTS